MAKEEQKKIVVDATKNCDMCDKKAKYMGANSLDGKIFRACEEHKADIQKALKDENN